MRYCIKQSHSSDLPYHPANICRPSSYSVGQQQHPLLPLWYGPAPRTRIVSQIVRRATVENAPRTPAAPVDGESEEKEAAAKEKGVPYHQLAVGVVKESTAGEQRYVHDEYVFGFCEGSVNLQQHTGTVDPAG